MEQIVHTEDRVLLLGEADFSFTVALCEKKLQELSSCSDDCDRDSPPVAKVAKRRSPFQNIVTTCFDSLAVIESGGKYPKASANVSRLRELGVRIFFGVDATDLEISLIPQLTMARRKLGPIIDCEDDKEYKYPDGVNFKLILFNFPHTGGKTNIRKCRQLLNGIFASCSKYLDIIDGEIVITLAPGQSGLGSGVPRPAVLPGFAAGYAIDTPSCSVDLDNYLVMDKDGDGNSYKAISSILDTIHIKDSWTPVPLAAYHGLILSSLLPVDMPGLFPGYRPTGYKESKKPFHIQMADCLHFTRCDLLPSTTETLETADSATNLVSLAAIDDAPDLRSALNTTEIVMFAKLNLLGPIYRHDISFWHDDTFDQQLVSGELLFSDSVRDLSFGLVKFVTLLSQYCQTGATGTPFKSLCYRLLWNSFCLPLTHECVRDMQNELRQKLTTKFENLGIYFELR